LVDRIPRAEQDLRRRVIGQPDAVRAVSRALAAGTMNIDFVADPHSAEARPKGVFFFAGPTGVGKTELARALSDVIFDDETALTRFDMSTFAEEHSAERLTGAPPGYVGHERGGELTNRVMSRPFSVLLFDEIEKGHVAVFDKFLQILEDGRLTDGLGRTAYFSQSLIIFTSNLGAAPLYERLQQGELPSYQEVSELFQTEVSHHFATTLNRPELLGRIGNGVLAFDLLRPENIPAITAKFLDQLIASAARAGIALDVERESVTDGVRRAMADPRSLALGGREIRNILDRSVRAPLIDRVVESGSRTGHFHVELPEGRAVAVVSRTPDRRIG
jgi:ATP-dependent Clp protease ATP-binding subunit ClpA